MSRSPPPGILASMQNETTQRSLDSVGARIIPTFRVVTVFEDLRTARQAGRAYDFLVANLTHEWRVTSEMWKFELLGHLGLRELAAKDAAVADLVIIACRGDRELPLHVSAWIEIWLSYQPQAVALVSLLDYPHGRPRNGELAKPYLQGAAERAHMEFFAWPAGVPQQSVVLQEVLASMAEPLFEAA